MQFRAVVKKIAPPRMWAALLAIRATVHRVFKYDNYDATSYWKKRATSCEGEERVLWRNQQYNHLYRDLQREVLKGFTELSTDLLVLDIGCGTGIVSKMITELNPYATVDAIDFHEMIEIAKEQNPSDRINYMISSAEDYFISDKKYHLIVSSACLSSMRDIAKMKKAVANAVRMVDENGTILMMDHFHKWNFLARAKFSSQDMIELMSAHGFKTCLKSGVLFWPYREWLANSTRSGSDLEQKFNQGERILAKLGRHFWADYKILAFRKRMRDSS
jgi:2-polyprenyl-3-methyl-5-hydroxy-6-metoxy-1,4-benzoquinol methylase